MTTITADHYRSLAMSSRSSAATSSVSMVVQRMLVRTKNEVNRAASSLPSRALADLAKAAMETTRRGWDGYNAPAITPKTLDRAQAFLEGLPPWMPAPDIVPEPDGEIAIEWYLAADLTFSISIGESGPLHYAGRFGPEDEEHGLKGFDGVAIPETILRLVGRLFANPAVRRAA